MQRKHSISKLVIGIILIAGSVFCNISFSQYSLITRSSPYITLHGGTSAHPVYLIINQAATTGISVVSGTGKIISEGEFNYVDWVIGNSTGTYVVPFYDTLTAAVAIPFSMAIGNAGNNSNGYVLFSTYHTGSDLTPYATYNGNSFTGNIPNVNLEYSSGSDNSAEMVNRWWIVDAESYDGSYVTFTNRPYNVTFTFKFRASELHGLTGANLEAQPFVYNNTETIWDPTIIFSKSSYTTGTPETFVANPVANANNLFRAWVLVNSTTLLPIELLTFNAVCEGNKISLTWSTASETNNNYFTVERSKDAQTWEKVTTVQGARNSNTILYYSAVDIKPYLDYTYYQLKQTDYNGTFTFSNVVIAGCGSKTPFNVVSINQSQQGEGIVIQLSAGEGEQYTYAFYDIRGRLLQNKSAKAVEGMNEVYINTQGISNGIYLITLQNETKLISRKIFISNHF